MSVMTCGKFRSCTPPMVLSVVGSTKQSGVVGILIRREGYILCRGMDGSADTLLTSDGGLNEGTERV